MCIQLAHLARPEQVTAPLRCPTPEGEVLKHFLMPISHIFDDCRLKPWLTCTQMLTHSQLLNAALRLCCITISGNWKTHSPLHIWFSLQKHWFIQMTLHMHFARNYQSWCSIWKDMVPSSLWETHNCKFVLRHVPLSRINCMMYSFSVSVPDSTLLQTWMCPHRHTYLSASEAAGIPALQEVPSELWAKHKYSML